MQRDMDVAREILFQIERFDAFGPFVLVQIDGVAPEKIQYHLKLLRDAGLVDAQVQDTSTGSVYLPLSLTWAGHEFLDAARDDTRWNNVKQLVLEKTGGLAFDVLKSVLLKVAMNAFF